MPRQFNDAVELKEQTTPATPATGRVRLYAKVDGKLYSLDDVGAETALGGGSFMMTSVEVDITTALGGTAARTGRFTITNAVIGATSKVLVTQSGRPITGKGTRADENEMDTVICKPVAAAGSATVYWASATFVKGVFDFDYAVA